MTEKISPLIDNAHHVIEKASSTVTYAASGVTVVSGLTFNEWVALGGLIIALSSFAFNVWFKMKYKRKEN